MFRSINHYDYKTIPPAVVYRNPRLVLLLSEAIESASGLFCQTIAHDTEMKLMKTIIPALTLVLGASLALNIFALKYACDNAPKQTKEQEELAFCWSDWGAPQGSINGTNHTEWAQWRTNALNRHQEFRVCKQQD